MTDARPSTLRRSSPKTPRTAPPIRKRSSKRERIRDVFLAQQGHVSADELFDLVRGVQAGIGRATVYRSLQWMVETGVARKVDFGDGRSRFEPSPHRPRHFHLVCTSCQRSSEFLSSDIESFVDEVAAARGFAASQTVVQVYGICSECRTGAGAPPVDGATTERLFARDALRMAVATEQSGLEFYTRAARLTRDARGKAVFEKLAGEEREHLATLQNRYRDLVAADPDLESRPTFLFFKGAASGLFVTGVGQLTPGIDDEQALLIGIRCERGSHQFFKRYGERFEESEGKRIFLEFADEERAHQELLVREYRALRERRRRAAGPARPRPD
jgi:Fur family ferric uptake transcriptional regulator